MSDPIDYERILSSLLEERGDLDRMIAWAQKKLGQPSAPAKPYIGGPDKIGLTKVFEGTVVSSKLAPDMFFRMSVSQAIKTYLNIARRPQSAKDITAALSGGGLTHKAKNLYATVYPTLLRMEEDGVVARVGKGEWGLSEWYPGGRKSSQQEEKIQSEV